MAKKGSYRIYFKTQNVLLRSILQIELVRNNSFCKLDLSETIVDIVGQGSVIGEMAVLTGVKRTATVTADTQVTALWLPTAAMQEIMSSSDELEYQLWDTAGKRFAMNMLGRMEPVDSRQETFG